MLEWDDDTAFVGPFELNVWTGNNHSGGWRIFDASGNTLDEGFPINHCDAVQLRFWCEEAMRHRLRMAAETLDSSWLEARGEPVDDPQEEAVLATGHSGSTWIVPLNEPHQELADQANKIIQNIMDRTAAYNEFALLYGRAPSDEELKDFGWRLKNLPPGAWCQDDEEEEDGCARCGADASSYYHDDSNNLYCPSCWAHVCGGPEPVRGYDQILAAIREEAKGIKL